MAVGAGPGTGGTGGEVPGDPCGGAHSRLSPYMGTSHHDSVMVQPCFSWDREIKRQVQQAHIHLRRQRADGSEQTAARNDEARGSQGLKGLGSPGMQTAFLKEAT